MLNRKPTARGYSGSEFSPNPNSKSDTKPVTKPVTKAVEADLKTLTLAKPISNKPVSNKPSPKSAQLSKLETLLRLEGEALGAKDFLALKHIAVNRSRALISCGHIIWVRRNGANVKLSAITAQDQFDPNTPFAQWLQAQLKSRAQSGELDHAATWQFKSQRSTDAFSYPFTHAHYAPFAPHAKSGGLLFTSDTAFAQTAYPLLARLGHIFGVSDAAMRSKKRARMSGRKRVYFFSTLIALGLIALIPVPITSLAPAEIVAAQPFVISAPINGVVKTILVPPNSTVSQGTPLVQLEDTTLRNEFILAQQEFNLAEARRRQASLRAFIDHDAKRELAIAEAELKLATANMNYAKERMALTVITAPQDGLALFTDLSEWTGRPVSTGEAILKIADPTRVLLRIDAPLAHGKSLQSGARVRLFLDADPIHAISAQLSRASYQATPTPEGGMAYETYAHFDSNDISDDKSSGQRLRIGGRGVAKIYGETAPIGYWLIRRPLTLARQILGV